MKKTNTKNSAFTLIEMLAVMFIIAIIFSIALPAYTPMLRTMNVGSSAEKLSNTLEFARQHAVTNGTTCYVVFAPDFLSYKVVMTQGNGYISADKWQFLPNGINIDPACTFMTSPPNPNTIAINFREDNSGQPRQVRYIEFQSNGAASLNRTLRLVDISNANIFKDILFYNQPIQINVS